MSNPLEPTMRGRYTMYDLPDGGLHIAYTVEEEPGSEPRHLEIPGMVVHRVTPSHRGL